MSHSSASVAINAAFAAADTLTFHRMSDRIADQCHVLVMVPFLEVDENNVQDPRELGLRPGILCEMSYGNTPPAENVNRGRAFQLAAQLWRHRGTNYDPQDPYSVFPGDTRCAMGVIINNVIVTCSGAPSAFLDLCIAQTTATMLLTLAQITAGGGTSALAHTLITAD